MQDFVFTPSIPISLHRVKQTLLWIWGCLVAAPEFLCPQQRAGIADTPNEVWWHIAVRLYHLSVRHTLRDCVVRLVPVGYEDLETPSGGFKNQDRWNRKIDLRWQTDEPTGSAGKIDLHKGNIYLIPIAKRIVHESGQSAETQLTSQRYLLHGQDNKLEPGKYYFKVELKSGGKWPWYSDLYYRIIVPPLNIDNGHFYVESWNEEQHKARFLSKK